MNYLVKGCIRHHTVGSIHEQKVLCGVVIVSHYKGSGPYWEEFLIFFGSMGLTEFQDKVTFSEGLHAGSSVVVLAHLCHRVTQFVSHILVDLVKPV